jgi:X-X-X-Leu-X-X-Gly heptad repeat protein
MKIEGFVAGDRAWAAWAYMGQGCALADASATVHLAMVDVVMPDGGIVQPVGSVPRVVYYGERLFATQQEARQWVAAQLAAGAARLANQAADLAEPVVVTV